MKYFFIASFYAAFSWLVHGTEADVLDQEDLEFYTARLGLEPDHMRLPLDQTLLTNLVKSHVVKIPFENLNMHTLPARPITIAHESLINKILHDSEGHLRGGYCYELNELFYLLLKTLGFNVQRHKASVWMGKDPGIIPWPSHQLLSVKIDDKIYMVDVAFGLFTLYEPVMLPALVGESREFIDSQGKKIKFEKVLFDESFGSEQEKKEGFIYSRFSEKSSNYERLSTFTLVSYNAQDYYEHNNYVQYEYRPFKERVMFTRFNQEGRMIICVRVLNNNDTIQEIIRWINAQNPDFGAFGIY